MPKTWEKIIIILIIISAIIIFLISINYQSRLISEGYSIAEAKEIVANKFGFIIFILLGGAVVDHFIFKIRIRKSK